MANYISFQPSDFFGTKIYTGTGATHNVTGVGFQPDFVWMKRRDGSASHRLCDSVRGATELLQSNASDAEQTGADTLTSFDSDGFTLGADAAPYKVNVSGQTMVSWNWKMGTTSGLTGGSLTPTAYSINTTAKQGIYTYTGTGSTATIAHGLGVTPTAIFIKKTSGAENWAVYSKSMGNTKYTILNTYGAIQTGTAFWNDTSPTDTVFTIKDNVSVNTSGQTYVAYVFCDTPGYFKQGAYTGNGNTDGALVYTGFAPSYVFLKNDADSENWHAYDNKRNAYNVRSLTLDPDQANAEYTIANGVDFLANGFKWRQAQAYSNDPTYTYVYMAFAEHPFVGSGTNPVTAR